VISRCSFTGSAPVCARRDLGITHGQRRAALDARRAVANDPVKPLAHLVDHALDALFRERVLVSRLGRGEQVERLHALVADQRLAQVRFALGHIDEIEHHAALGAHHEIEIAQANVKIDDRHLLAGLREGGAQRRS